MIFKNQLKILKSTNPMYYYTKKVFDNLYYIYHTKSMIYKYLIVIIFQFILMVLNICRCDPLFYVKYSPISNSLSISHKTLF